MKQIQSISSPPTLRVPSAVVLLLYYSIIVASIGNRQYQTSSCAAFVVGTSQPSGPIGLLREVSTTRFNHDMLVSSPPNSSMIQTVSDEEVVVDMALPIHNEESRKEKGNINCEINSSNFDGLGSKYVVKNERAATTSRTLGPDHDEQRTAQRRSTVTASAASAVALLERTNAGKTASKPQDKSSRFTSIGRRRIGSATKARQGMQATSRLIDAIRKAAQAECTPEYSHNHMTTTATTRTLPSSLEIHNAVNEIMRTQNVSSIPSHPTIEWNSSVISAAFSSVNKVAQPLSTSNGLPVSSTKSSTATDTRARLLPGSVLIPRNTHSSVRVRIATASDDAMIAGLRLSVFSNFAKEQREHFCSRSCQAIAGRRLRGAICVVATLRRPTHSADEIVVGSAEISFHEFFGTQLGRRRPQFSVLYITEVAVCPSQRRRGIGKKLLQAIKLYGKRNGVETLYLHVDVLNQAALALYQQAGFCCVDETQAMFKEFTTLLNLHPGATKGRNHHLMSCDLTTSPTWFEESESDSRHSAPLGFEVPV